MSARMNKSFALETQNLGAAGLLRPEIAVDLTADMQAQFGQKTDLVNFVSTDYLGWRNNDAVQESARQACAQYGTGCTSSRNSIGTQEILLDLEKRLAAFLGVEACIVFASNYVAKMALFEPLMQRKDRILIDEMCDPGLLDGSRMCDAGIVTYYHNDDEHLEYHLKCSQNFRFRLIVSDGVFNTDGQLASLERIQSLQKTYDAELLLDESLALGILGENGHGSCSHLQLERQADLLSGSFAYALGNVAGGFVAGSGDLIGWLRHTSRAYLLSEPLSPIHAATVLKVLDLLEAGDAPIKRLDAVSERLKEAIRQKDWKLIDSDHPMVSINVGSTLNAQRMVEHLFAHDLIVSGLCYPNTPEGESLIRIVPTVEHSDAQIDALIGAIDQGYRLLE